MTIIEFILIFLSISQCLNFYMTIKINDKVTKILEYIDFSPENNKG